MITDISQFTKGVTTVEGIYPDAKEPYRMAVNDELKSFIDIYESEYLRKAIGCEMSVDFSEYIENRPDDEMDRIKKWENLIDWFDKCKVSPIACYIFFHYTRHVQSKVTASGTLSNNTDNPIVSSMQKMVTAWNLMVTSNFYLNRFMENNKKDYTEFEMDNNLLQYINEFGI